jgi:hypothetical protein
MSASRQQVGLFELPQLADLEEVASQLFQVIGPQIIFLANSSRPDSYSDLRQSRWANKSANQIASLTSELRSGMSLMCCASLDDAGFRPRGHGAVRMYTGTRNKKK